jgi:hypothetical protein
MEKVRTEILETQSAKLTKTRELIEFLVLSAAALLVPFLLGHPQFLVGTLVNATLILAVLNLKNYKVLPILLLPSIGVLTKGLIFGPFTVLLVYMIPFIWIGNLILAYSVKGMKSKWLGLVIGAVLKMAFLYSVATVLIKLGVLPKPFALSMGMIQLYTALAGGVLALTINGLKNKFVRS